MGVRRRGGVSPPLPLPPEKEGGGGVVGWRACREKRDRMAGLAVAVAGERGVGSGERDVGEERRGFEIFRTARVESRGGERMDGSGRPADGICLGPGVCRLVGLARVTDPVNGTGWVNRQAPW